MSESVYSDFVLNGTFTLDGQIEATQLSIHFGSGGHFSVSAADKKPPKREVILFPFLQRMLSSEGTEYIGDGIKYTFSGNQLGVYHYQFRGEGDFRRVKEWSLLTTYSETEPTNVKIAGVTHPDVIHLSHGKYGEGPTTTFTIEFTIPNEQLMEVLGMNDMRFKYFLELKEKQL